MKFISYKDWLNEADITPSVNKHMTHAEDLVILGGREGLKWVIDMFKQLYLKLQGNTEESKVSLSVKFDGAPSVFVWSKFPDLEKPGLAIKGLFAKDRKIIFNEKDVDKFYNEQPDLAKKLKILLEYIPKLGIPKNQIWQGDLLFDKSTLQSNGKQYSFHPNTIVYKVDKDSDIGKKIGKSEIGVVWHTRYEGTSLDDISAKYNTKTSELKDHPKVFMTDPYISSFAGIITFTEEESAKFNNDIYEIETLARNLFKDSAYNKIIQYTELIDLFKIFQNSLIRKDIRVINADQFIENFEEFLYDRFEKEIDGKKSEKGKQAVQQKQEKFLNEYNELKDTLAGVATLILKITDLKSLFIKKLNNIGKFETYLQTNSQRFIPTGEEGFAVSDINGNVVKLVDRYEFSFANFSPNIQKGWAK